MNEDTSKIRRELEEKEKTGGLDVLFRLLQEKDPEYAEKLHPNDKKRIIRGLEIIEAHGKTVTQINRESTIEESPFDYKYIGVNYADRKRLYDRINRRVDIMMEKGLLAEAERMFLNKGGKTASQAIGHKEFFPYFRGECSLGEAIERLKTETRRYAKRQITWFGRNSNINWIYPDCTDDTLELAIELINMWL